MLFDLDLLIGAHGADASGNAKLSAGESYVIFGKASLPTTIDLNTLGMAGITIFGADTGDKSGYSLSSAGDVNGDGFDDLIIGAYLADASGNAKVDAGESYVIFGKASLPTTIDLTRLGLPGITLFGADAGDRSGNSVSSAGDVNGDGFDDLIIGAYKAAASGNAKTRAGDSYVIFGGDFTEAVTHPGTSAAETLSGNASANVMIGGRGNDTLIGNGGADVLRGGEGNDVLAVSSTSFQRVVGGNGSDTLRLDGTGLSLNLTTLKDNPIVDIEAIDITGSGNNTLTLNQREVLNISGDSNTLLVRRNAGDVVNIGLGWTQGANQTIGGIAYHVFTQGVATLVVQVTQTGSNMQVAGTTLTVTGSALADAVVVSASTNITVSFNGIAMDFTPVQVKAIIVNGDAGADSITVNSLPTTTSFTANGGSGNDVLTVAAAVTRATTLNGDADNDTLTGGGGIDTLTGGSGNDSLIGGLGNDTYVFGPATTAEADTVTEVADQGTDTLNFSSLTTTVTLNLGSSLVQTVHTNRTLALSSSAAFENVNGGTAADMLLGNSLNNVINGGAGHDVLVGNSGNDTLNGDTGRDILIGGMGLDTVNGGSDYDILIAGRTTNDTNIAGLTAFRTEWTSGGTYASRVANLKSGVGVPVVSLKAKTTVLNDAGEDDVLTGGDGTDWFFRALDDVITDLFAGEAIDVL